jgi:AraC family transcriptional regulator
MSQRQSTRQAWLDRFIRVADHVADHLDDPLDLQRLAEIACLSPYHFQRSWLAFTGETLAQMVTRLRLHRAAGRLIASDAAVEAVARQAGYGSAAAFTRADARRPPTVPKGVSARHSVSRCHRKETPACTTSASRQPRP